MVSHCQCQFSCFSCCGLLNIKLNTSSLYKLLVQRTRIFKKITNNFTKFERNTLLKYRIEREKRESQLEKYNNEVYVCPFLGIIHDKKIGCMVHPKITNEEKSQDVSFYGSAICQSYDCMVKEEDKNFIYKKIIEVAILRILNSKIINDSIKNQEIKKRYYSYHFLYSRFIGDIIFYRFVKFYLDLEFILQNEEALDLFVELCIMRLRLNYHITSFEINYHRYVENINDFCEDFKKIFLVSDDKICCKFKNLLKLC